MDAPLVLPEPLHQQFTGFPEEAFAILDRLKLFPNIKQYRKEKPDIKAYLRGPFGVLRDDLVVNWVLPNALDYETERGVFSRLLKNDFGAGGAHHHLWMAFYRTGMRRIMDVQMALSLSPDGLSVSVFVGEHMKAVFRDARDRMLQQPGHFLDLLNPLLHSRNYTWQVRQGRGKERVTDRYAEPLEALPDTVASSTDLWVRTLIPRERVLSLNVRLLDHVLEAIHDLWPIYVFWLGTVPRRAPSAGPPSFVVPV